MNKGGLPSIVRSLIDEFKIEYYCAYRNYDFKNI